ncbi:MAG: lysophospholipid acyltransferase family protein [Candidatus Omnitrophica bacterium]|nr:lysophospholipid acyltransferase family protein [Candidatus Omnitrophota bacterium]
MAKYKPYRFLLYLGLEFLRHLVLVLPRRVNHALAASIGFSAYWVLPKERAKTLRHLKEAFGEEKSKDEFLKIGQGAFVHLAKSAIDVLSFPKLNRKRIEKLVRLEGGTTERLDRALARGKGVIALTGHLGNWELLASYFRFLGYPGCLVGRKIYYGPFDEVLVTLRRSALVTTVYRDESPRQILTELRQNHVVGMSADQDIDSLEGTFVLFFGKPSWTPIGPAKIALASGAAIVPAFMIHEGDHYRLFIEEPIVPMDCDSKEEAIKLMTEAWSQVVERYIRLFPNQWVWMHNRWKTKVEFKSGLMQPRSLEEVAL